MPVYGFSVVVDGRPARKPAVVASAPDEAAARARVEAVLAQNETLGPGRVLTDEEAQPWAGRLSRPQRSRFELG